MCRTWYLSLPVGTIFAFSINADASVAKALSDSATTHASTSNLTANADADEIQAQSTSTKELKERKKYVGYVRELSASSVSIGILASSPCASAPNTDAETLTSHPYSYTPRRRSAGNARSSTHNSTRHGVEVDHEGMFVIDSGSGSDTESDDGTHTSKFAERVKSHPLLAAHQHTAHTLRQGAEALFGDAEVAKCATEGSRCQTYSKYGVVRNQRGCDFDRDENGKGRRASWPASASEISKELRASTRMSPTRGLPWRRVYAYAPYLRGATTSSSSSHPDSPKIRQGPRTRLVVGNLDGSGVGRHAWARFTRGDVERSEEEMKKTLEDTLPANGGTAPDSSSVNEYTLPTDIPIVIDVQLDVSDVRHLIATPAEFEEEVKAVEREVMAAMKAKGEEESDEGKEATPEGKSSREPVGNTAETCPDLVEAPPASSPKLPNASHSNRATQPNASPPPTRSASTPADFTTGHVHGHNHTHNTARKHTKRRSRRPDLSILPTRTLSYIVLESPEEDREDIDQFLPSSPSKNSFSGCSAVRTIVDLKSYGGNHHHHHHHHHHQQHDEDGRGNEWFDDGVPVEEIVPVGWVR